MSTYQRKETHASIRRNRHPDCNLLAIDQEQQVTQVTTTRTITILTGGYIFITRNFYTPLYEYIPNPKGPIMFKNPWTGLIVYAIVKISAFMLIRMWLQKAIDELLESDPSLKDMYPEQF